MINCDAPKYPMSTLPENNRAERGPGEDLIKAGLEPITHLDAIVQAEDDAVEVTMFEILKYCPGEDISKSVFFFSSHKFFVYFPGSFQDVKGH